MIYWGLYSQREHAGVMKCGERLIGGISQSSKIEPAVSDPVVVPYANDS